jgi:hypothetical protein
MKFCGTPAINCTSEIVTGTRPPATGPTTTLASPLSLPARDQVGLQSDTNLVKARLQRIHLILGDPPVRSDPDPCQHADEFACVVERIVSVIQ